MEIINTKNNGYIPAKQDFKILHRVFGAVSFLFIFILFTMTVQPSVPFWDCGEFLGMMTWQQVPHPPGAPLFSILGGFIQAIIPFGNLGWQGNMISVLSSALAVLFLYLMAVIVIKNLRNSAIETLGDALAVYGSSFVGAIALGVSATFWFNGIESEVYAAGTFNVVLVLYFLMRWTEVADEPNNERYLLLCMYLTGLSMGVHLLSMLVLFTLILVVYFRKYEVTPKSFIIMSVIGLLAYYVVISVIAQSLPAWLSGHSTGRNEAMEFTIQDSFVLQVFTVACILGLIYLFVRSYKRSKSVPALVSLSLLLIILSFSVFAHVYIRSNSNPPMNENSPKTITELARYIGREQYGYAPMWPRRYQQEGYFIDAYNKQDRNGNYIYGQWNPPTQTVVNIGDGRQAYAYEWGDANTKGDLSFMWKYQMNHMYWRYFLWNFVGRMSDVQDDGVAWFSTRGSEEANFNTGNFGIFPIRYFALPLLLGLIGLYYHFKRDPKTALVFLATFLVMGILTALYQNQQEPQPRERDYFYVGSFLIWGLWMAVGGYGLIDMLIKKAKSTAIVAGMLIISFLLVPFNMLYSNYAAYGRDGKFFPFDYAYNVLQSVEQDAILFTNGDNDTFPVWYMQDVEGVRRDVRICNLSLGNTLWYIDQLKNQEPWGAKKVPISISDTSLRVDETSSGAFSYDYGPSITDTIIISKDILSKFTTDTTIANSGRVIMTFSGEFIQNDDKNVPIYRHRVADKLVRNIITTNKFERPVYYIASAGSSAMCGLDSYMRREGLTYRVCPVPQQRIDGNDAYNEAVMDAMLLNINNSDSVSNTPKYEMKLRNLNNPNVVYDETDRRNFSMSYPGMFIGYAHYLASVKKDYDRAKRVLNTYLTYIPTDHLPVEMDVLSRIAAIYDLCGDNANMQKYAKQAIKISEAVIANEDLSPQISRYELIGRGYGPYQISSDAYVLLNNYEQAKTNLMKLAAKMKSLLSGVSPQSEDGQRLNARIANLEITGQELIVDKYEKEGKLKEAVAELDKIIENLKSSTNPYANYFMTSVAIRRDELAVKAGLPVATPPAVPFAQSTDTATTQVQIQQ